MANTKLSQIASGGATAGATDVVVAVRSGTTDVLVTPVALDTAQAWTAKQTFNNSDIALKGSSTGATTFASANASATNYTQTFPAATGTVLISSTPIAVGASLTAAVGGTYLLNTAAGSVLTLPAMTGSGATYEVIVTTATTSNAHKILAASGSDFLIGTAIGQNSNTPKMFQGAAATYHSIQMPFSGSQPSGGLVGDRYVIKDVAANLAEVTGTYSAAATPTTPFNAATS
jgi:hypothetical protein